MNVPFFDFNLAPDQLKDDWKNALAHGFESFDFILGPSVSNFESAWANFIGTQFSIGVGNGFDGLVLALKSLELPIGFTVAVPAHTFIASWSAVHFAGGIPIGVDVNSEGLLDLDQLENLVDIPDVVMPVHMHGRMVDMARLCEWAKRNKVVVIEDASQAHGAALSSISAGAWGDISVFSLYPSKNLGAFGDAGVICTSFAEIARNVRLLRNYGASEENKYIHQILGMNSRLDTLQAEILLVNLTHLPHWNERRREIAGIYLEKLKPNSQMVLPRRGGDEMVWHHFAIRHERRDELQLYLTNRGIQTQIHYPQSAGKEFTSLSGLSHSYKIAEVIARETLSLPISPWHTNSHIEAVIQQVNAFHGN